MTHLKIYLSVIIMTLPGPLPAQDSGTNSSTVKEIIEDVNEEFDPSSATSGTLPSPVSDPRTPSPVPKSGLFYILPIIGLWMILRRRSYRYSNR